ncbi:glycosyltransferase [Heyndrickxia sporothermodurans]|uniref:Glycosyltransferase family 2 protein n=1 Tax=Heyndrickxia sporothermodurans TaxID=46224 RepID=A0AB37H3S4_9BACI|nr:glycosyltransferase family 2 protein [Heyndrickxia sporothermodurans]MBL5767067.1 glycosyltransferase family 2 protein [Heyndrickxia sporothermodurans]MBL5770566.1 glycosyltransferase family 2 protein [Heyndrickxia sporothermodurans]MBL5776073.1 glycosyltransferase family 2 protein [Heyndrickxia sporothermodurans]MBL5777486.1 glycosyltransferase family 2 protein [Heyndrickxia sporothermodurans]MBL5781113.1 glycosyltransferase family 2 protein [Heyndrickxia sporothermodurans]
MFKVRKKNRLITYNSLGYHIVDNKLENRRKPSKVTVITPVYNSEKHLRKTIDSVINQSIGFENIEYILIDDCSTDSSRDILLDYSSKFDNIIVVFLKCNTGTPGKPRNIGIHLSTSKYITFLDADDWLEPTGIESLHNILEETGSDYVVGKTIQYRSAGTKIIGEHESCKERRAVSPFSIPHIFHHLGPRARMIRASVIKENQIQFPEMKFAEDKQFFIDVLTHCNTISTTKTPIYYLNRLDNQQTRLTNQTNIMQKTECNLKVINYIINKNLELEKEQMILNRLYEYDCIERFFATPHFQKTKLKRVYYYKLNKVLKTTKGLRYEFSDHFLQPINKVVYELFRQKNYKELEKLFEWNNKEKVKDVLIKDNLPYIISPLLEDEHKYIRIPLFAKFKEDYFTDDTYKLNFFVYGERRDKITEVIIKDGKNAFREYSLPVVIDESGYGRLEIDLNFLNKLPTSTYSIFLRYDEYMKINIRKLTKNQIEHQFQNRKFIFHNTVYSNVGLKIRRVV